MFKQVLVGSALGAALLSPALPAPAAGFSENFTTDPAARGWLASGNTGLFAWDAGAGHLAATWDSRQPNSYFARPLGVVLRRTNDFCLVFDLRLADFTSGVNPPKTNSSFQLAVGLIRLADATAPGFHRGSGFESPNLCDFSFFPDPGGDWQYGPSLTTTLIDATGFNWSWDGFQPTGLSTGDVFRVTMAYRASDAAVQTAIQRNGEPFVTVPPAVLRPPFTDFELDHVAVCSYNDDGQFPGYEGSLLAHGTVDNLTFLPALPVSQLRAVRQEYSCGVSFVSHSGWWYDLERKDPTGWTTVLAGVRGTDSKLTLADPNPAAAMGLYRVKARVP